MYSSVSFVAGIDGPNWIGRTMHAFEPPVLLAVVRLSLISDIDASAAAPDDRGMLLAELLVALSLLGLVFAATTPVL
ncbi:MAG: hypothetical protein ACRELA_20710, partial [Candidatus Rokuibacteriota bacterium]